MSFASEPFLGEPNHLCDLVASRVVEAYLDRDPETRIRCHVCGGNGSLFITGEFSSSADFDVAQSIRSFLAKMGILDELEPFVSLDPVSSERLGIFRNGALQPVFSFGYATPETRCLLPTSVVLARNVISLLLYARRSQSDFFWMGLNGRVTVSQRIISIHLDIGEQDPVYVRRILPNYLYENGISRAFRIAVYPCIPYLRSGLDAAFGASGSPSFPYGAFLPSVSFASGQDPCSASWQAPLVARAIAVRLCRKYQTPVFVSLGYAPGEIAPLSFRIRDACGRDLSADISRDQMRLDPSRCPWDLDGTLSEVAKYGFVGHPSFLWEK